MAMFLPPKERGSITRKFWDQSSGRVRDLLDPYWRYHSNQVPKDFWDATIDPYSKCCHVPLVATKEEPDVAFCYHCGKKDYQYSLQELEALQRQHENTMHYYDVMRHYVPGRNLRVRLPHDPQPWWRRIFLI